MGFISFSVCWSKYICLRSFLLNQLSMVSEKLWFGCSSSVSVWAIWAATQADSRVSATLAVPTIWDASATFPAASFITRAAPRVSAMLDIHYWGCSYSLCYVSYSLPKLYVKSSISCLLVILFLSFFYNRSVKSCL